MGRPDLASRALKTVRWTVFTRRDVGRRARAVQIRPMFSRRRLLQIKRCNPLRGCILVGPAGFEPTQWRSQSPLPYRLATAQQKKRPRSIITVRSLVGCLERFELSASRATIWRANQLRHRHHIMRPKGLEPPAHCLEGSCSIHLSYGRTLLSQWVPLWRQHCVGTGCERNNTIPIAFCQGKSEKSFNFFALRAKMTVPACRNGLTAATSRRRPAQSPVQSRTPRPAHDAPR